MASTAKGRPARRQPLRYCVLCVSVAPATGHAVPERSGQGPRCPFAGRDVTASPHSRFSAEKNSELKAEPLSKAPPTASQSPARGRRNRGAWLGLKDEDFLDLELSSPSKASPAGSSPSPAAAGRPSPARQLPAAEEAATKTDPVEEEDWLSAALRRKKAQAQAKAQEGNAKPSEAPVEGLPPRSPVR